MGFLRKDKRRRRDNRAETEKRARRLLGDGDYESATRAFIHCGMSLEAADAYMKAGDTCTGIDEAWNQYRSAIRLYDKAGNPDGVREACEKCWRIDWRCVYQEDLQRLTELGLLEQFITNVKDHEPYWLARALEESGQLEHAAETYVAAAVAVNQSHDRIQPRVVFSKAIECGKKASMNGERLLEIHKDFFRTVISQPSPKEGMEFFVNYMSWLMDSGNLNRFVDAFLQERAIFLCFVLSDFMDITGKPINDEVAPMISDCLLQCLKEIQDIPSTDPDWEIVEGKHRRYSTAADWLSYLGKFEDAARVHLVAAELDWYKLHMEKAVKCYKKAGQPLKAASLLERLGRLKEAAGLAEDSGDTSEAIRLYKHTLMQGKIESTEAKWIETTLKRLRELGKKPLALEAGAPAAGEAADCSRAHQSCPDCRGAEAGKWAHPIYCAQYTGLTSALPFLINQSGSRKKTKQKPKQKPKTKFVVWKDHGDACFVFEENRIKFSYRGKLCDLNLKSGSRAHTLLKDLHGFGPIRSEDLKRVLDAKKGKPYDWIRSINLTLNTKIARFGYQSIPDNVAFVKLVSRHKDCRFTIPTKPPAAGLVDIRFAQLSRGAQNQPRWAR
jgi:tetratricopeptide (TPR) repeat protein